MLLHPVCGDETGVLMTEIRSVGAGRPACSREEDASSSQMLSGASGQVLMWVLPKLKATTEYPDISYVVIYKLSDKYRNTGVRKSLGLLKRQLYLQLLLLFHKISLLFSKFHFQVLFKFLTNCSKIMFVFMFMTFHYSQVAWRNEKCTPSKSLGLRKIKLFD